MTRTLPGASLRRLLSKRPAAAEMRPDFMKEEDGAAALEFAIVLLPLMLLTVGTLETGIVFFRSAMLEGAANMAARSIRVGTAGSVADPQAEFRRQLCDRIMTVNCSDLKIEVIDYTSFSEAQSDKPVFNDEGELQSRGFDTGNASSVITVRVVYKNEFFTPLLGELITGTSNSYMLVSSVAIFQNEPWDDKVY